MPSVLAGTAQRSVMGPHSWNVTSVVNKKPEVNRYIKLQ